MTKAALQKITAWSYSRYRDYVTCPAKAKYKHVEKLKEPGNAAMDRGSAIHELAKQYAGGKLKRMPVELAKFKEEFKKLKAATPQCEQDWAFTDKWGRTGWFDPDVWVRIKVDAAYEQKDYAVVIDHKTGQLKDDYQDQCELYAIAAFIIFRTVKEVRTKLWFIDHGEEREVVYKRKDLEKLQEKWAKATKAMLADTRFAPRPGNYCRWCHFRKSNGGPCQF